MLTSFLSTAPAPSAIYTLSLHDALPISLQTSSTIGVTGLAKFILPLAISGAGSSLTKNGSGTLSLGERGTDRKSTRLNSSHRCISYAVFCLKKKKEQAPDTNHSNSHASA